MERITLGTLLLGIYLVLRALGSIFNLSMALFTLAEGSVGVAAALALMQSEGHPRTNNWGLFLTALWVLTTAVFSLLAHFAAVHTNALIWVLPIVAAAAGVLLLLSGPALQRQRTGTRLLAAWFIVLALMQFFTFLRFNGMGIGTALLGGTAGVFLILRK